MLRIRWPIKVNIFPWNFAVDFSRIIHEHEKDFDMSSPRDFIDVYLAEIQNKRSENFDIEQLVVICLDFFQVYFVFLTRQFLV